MKWTKEDGKLRGWLYTYMQGTTAVVLNRADEVIHEAPTFEEAYKWANEHPDLIDAPLNRKGSWKQRNRLPRRSRLASTSHVSSSPELF